MKAWLILSLAILFLSYPGNTKIANSQELEIDQLSQIPELQSIIDSSGVIGYILLYDYQKDTYYSNDFERANEGKLPASTFKIVHSIIGLETGVIKSDSVIFKWDGTPKGNKNWEQDLILRNAYHLSCVSCYQDVARKIGELRMNQYLDKLDYGSMAVDSNTVDNFWLRGNSRITPWQQIDFLKRLYTSELPISERTRKIMKNLMVIEETGQYTLSGKSVLSNENQIYNGWFIGYIERGADICFFATNIEPETEFDFDTFIKKRKNVTLIALKRMKIIL